VKTSYDKQLHILQQVLVTEHAQEVCQALLMVVWTYPIQGGNVAGSWFGDSDEMSPTAQCFTVRLPSSLTNHCTQGSQVNVMRNPTGWVVGQDIRVGTVLGLWVNLHRSDKDVEGSVQRVSTRFSFYRYYSRRAYLQTYALEADFFIPVM
jgi:hypothetical protein